MLPLIRDTCELLSDDDENDDVDDDDWMSFPKSSQDQSTVRLGTPGPADHKVNKERSPIPDIHVI